MKIKYEPEGGRYGYGFDCFCALCGIYLGNTTGGGKNLKHPTAVKEGKIFRKIMVNSACIQAGKECLPILPLMEITDL